MRKFEEISGDLSTYWWELVHHETVKEDTDTAAEPQYEYTEHSELSHVVGLPYFLTLRTPYFTENQKVPDFFSLIVLIIIKK